MSTKFSNLEDFLRHVEEGLSWAAPIEWEMVGEDGDYQVRFKHGGKELIADCPDRGVAEFIAEAPSIIRRLIKEVVFYKTTRDLITRL